MKKNLTNTLVAVSAIALVGIGAFLIFRKPKNQVPYPPYDPGGSGGSGGSGSGGSGSGGSNGTTPGIKFSDIADNIFDAMDGYGTDEPTIESELKKLRTKADWNALVSAYGTRTISSGRGNIFQPNFTGDLTQCLKNELDAEEETSVNNILSKLGVTI